MLDLYFYQFLKCHLRLKSLGVLNDRLRKDCTRAHTDKGLKGEFRNYFSPLVKGSHLEHLQVKTYSKIDNYIYPVYNLKNVLLYPGLCGGHNQELVRPLRPQRAHILQADTGMDILKFYR